MRFSMSLLPFNACQCLPMLIRHPLSVCLNKISPVCLTLQFFPTHVCIKKNALQPFSHSYSTPTVPQVFQIGLCGVIEADLGLSGNSWSGGSLREWRYFSTLQFPAAASISRGVSPRRHARPRVVAPRPRSGVRACPPNTVGQASGLSRVGPSRSAPPLWPPLGLRPIRCVHGG